MTKSEYILLAETVKGQKFTIRKITNLFNKIDKTEYSKLDKEQLINHLWKLTNN